jgi:hypothetical protein
MTVKPSPSFIRDCTYTEDDTFTALRRASIPEMLGYYDEWVLNRNSKFESLDDMCKRHNWSWSEFSVAGAIYREKHNV